MSEQSNAREELEQNVVMLEQILEVMPDDVFTLRTLYETFLKLAQPERALETLDRLGEKSQQLKNEEMVSFVINQYKSVADGSPEIQARITALEGGADGSGPAPVADVPASSGAASLAETDDGDIEAEMSLAWDLFQDEQLTQEEYSSVLRDLTEVSSKNVGVPTTVLHVLNDQHFSRFERLMTHLCQKSHVPIMDLSRFEEKDEILKLLPADFCGQHGALPFGEVGEDLMLAILNPFDRDVVKKAENLLGRTCHPYLVMPSQYDQWLMKAKGVAA